MTVLHIPSFKGQVPRLGARKLDKRQAQIARNVDIWSKELRPIRTNLEVATPTKIGTVQSIYPLNNKWLHWITDVDVVPAPLQTSQDGRIYYTGDYNPKVSNNTLATVGSGTDYPLDYYRLGVPSPENAMTVGTTGGSSGIPETRTYVYTYVTEWGEEGPPSLAASYTTANNDATSWNLSAMDVAPLNTGVITSAIASGSIVTVTVSAGTSLETGDYIDIAIVVGMTDLNGRQQITRTSPATFTIVLTTAQTYTSGGTWTRESSINTTNMTKRIYRTVNGVYKFLAEIAVVTATYTDTTVDANLGESLQSINWISPPRDLKGLIALPNGSLCGFYNRTVAFTQPYVPHAWPTDYEYTFPYDVVAILAVGSMVVVLTKGLPYRLVGYHPANMSSSLINFRQACVSKRSAVFVLNGVAYASQDGIAYIPAAGRPIIISKPWMQKLDWNIYNPASIHSHVYDDRYYGFYSGAGDTGSESGCIVFDPADVDTAFTELGFSVTGGYIDLETDDMYLMEGTAITQWGMGGSHQVYTWLSKILTTRRNTNMAAAKVRLTLGAGVTQVDLVAAINAAVTAVQADISANVIMTTGGFNGAPANTYMVNGGPFADSVKGLSSPITAIFQLYGDGVLFLEKLLTDSKPFRLPPKSRAIEWQIQLTGNNVTIHEVMVGETISEFGDI